MSETVKLIVKIPKYLHEDLKSGKIYSSLCEAPQGLVEGIRNGTPLDDVKAEIREKSFNHYFEYGEYIGEDCRKERIIYSDKVIEILDNIGNAESEDIDPNDMPHVFDRVTEIPKDTFKGWTIEEGETS